MGSASGVPPGVMTKKDEAATRTSPAGLEYPRRNGRLRGITYSPTAVEYRYSSADTFNCGGAAGGGVSERVGLAGRYCAFTTPGAGDGPPGESVGPSGGNSSQTWIRQPRSPCSRRDLQ